MPLWVVALLACSLPAGALGQSAFAYQGRLTEAGVAANGTFDMQFKLFDTAAVGTGAQQGATLVDTKVAASNGVFTVTLDFGLSVFDGSARFLEISVRRAGAGNPYSTLSPRQTVTPVPYAISSLNAAQLDGRPSTSFVQADASGNVGLGTNAPAPGVRLEVNGATRLNPGGSGGFVQVGTPNGETGLSFIRSNRFDLRYDDSVLKLVAGTGGGPPPVWNGIQMNTDGDVGIGLRAVLGDSQWKLDIGGPLRITPAEGSGAVQFSTPNGELGLSLLRGGNRADLRYDGWSVRLVAGQSTGTPPSSNGVVVDAFGRVGIGTPSPFKTLHVNGDVAVTAGHLAVGTIGDAVARLQSQTEEPNTAAVYGRASAAGGVGVYGESTNGPAIQAKGHARQDFDQGGFAKAMIYVGTVGIVNCFNSFRDGAAATSGDCGIKLSFTASNFYKLTFPFPVHDRFFAVTCQHGYGDPADDTVPFATVKRYDDDYFSLEVSTWKRDVSGTFTEAAPFYLIVY